MTPPKNKWLQGTNGVKLYWGKNYNYAQSEEKNFLLISSIDDILRVTLKVKDFKTAKQIVECLER